MWQAKDEVLGEWSAIRKVIRVVLLFHLRSLANVGSQVTLEVTDLKTRPDDAALGADAGIVRKARPVIVIGAIAGG